MSDLDPATRARLDDRLIRMERWPNRDTECVVQAPDLRALLAAYDAAVAERDDKEARRQAWQVSAEKGAMALGAMRAERDQAAAVVRAAQAWVVVPNHTLSAAVSCPSCDALHAAVAALP